MEKLQNSPDSGARSDCHPLEIDSSQEGERIGCGGFRLHCSGVRFDDIPETSGIVSIARRHERIDGTGTRFETARKIPYGAEPQIHREWDFSGNRCLVTTRLLVRKGFPMNRLQIDEIRIDGVPATYAFLVFNGTTGVASLEWLPAPTAGQIVELPSNCLAILFRDASERLLEIGFGEDLWRWYAETDSATRAEHRITFHADGFSLHRHPGVWETPYESARTWKFNWYFAWEEPKAHRAAAAPSAEEPQSFSFERNANPAGARSFEFDGVPPQAAAHWKGMPPQGPCWSAPMTGRTLKAWIRSRAGTESEVSFRSATFHVCDSAAHLERPAKETLTHWDLPAMLDFHAWANRQFRQRSGGFRIFPAATDDIGNQLPSMRGMGETEMQEGS
jgi:hypothetical protein